MYSRKRRFRLFRAFGPVVDALRLQLSTSLTAYDAATANDWVKITKAEYDGIASAISGATKRGNTDTQINTREVNTSTVEVQFADPSSSSIPIAIELGEYVIAFIAEPYNGSGTVQFGTTTTFHTGTPTYGNSVTATGGGRNYYVRKTPTTPASQTLYPGLKASLGGYSLNAVSGTKGWYTLNGGSTWVAQENNAAKFQMIVTSTKSW